MSALLANAALGAEKTAPATNDPAATPLSVCDSITDDRLQLACFDKQANPLNAEHAVCVRMTNDSLRLYCFKHRHRVLLDFQSQLKALGVVQGPGKWEGLTKTSPIDDSLNVSILVKSEHNIESGYNVVWPKLIIRCKENVTNVYVIWNLYLGLDSTKMLTRFDKEPARTSTWSMSTGNKGVFVRGSNIEFIKQMMRHNRLLVRITPYGENPVMATFDIRELAEAIKPLRKACHW